MAKITTAVIKSLLCLGSAASLCVLLGACSKKYVQLDDVEVKNFEKAQAGEEIAVFEIEHMNEPLGEIRIKLFEDVAPDAVDNFKQLVESGYYNNCVFFYVSGDTYVMSGDPTGLGTSGSAAVETQCVPSNQLYNFTGAIAFPTNTGYCDSRFYIVTGSTVTADDFMNYAAQDNAKYFPNNVKAVYTDVGGQPVLDTNYNFVFGQVFEEDMKVLYDICSVELANNRPEKAVIITSASIVEYDGQ